jgi:hypothetical protein
MPVILDIELRSLSPDRAVLKLAGTVIYWRVHLNWCEPMTAIRHDRQAALFRDSGVARETSSVQRLGCWRRKIDANEINFLFGVTFTEH